MKPPPHVKTPAQYLAWLPADRAKTVAALRTFISKHIPRGFEEGMAWGTIGWTIPLSRYPDTHNKLPLYYVGLSSQKNYCALYLMGPYWSADQRKQLEAAFKTAGKKLDMGGGCLRFKTLDDLPLEPIGNLIAANSSEKWIELYEQTRAKTKMGQAKAKRAASSASKAPAKPSAAKRARAKSR